MAFLFSNFLAACRFKPHSEFKPQIGSAPVLSTTTPMTTKRSPSDEEAERTISRLLDIHEKLEKIGGDHLKPCDEVNLLFGDLVEMCIKTVSETITIKVLNDTRIIDILSSLHQLCAIAECHLESHWAKYISTPDSSMASSPTEAFMMISQVRDRLRSFPYSQNYTDITRMELSALSSLLTPTSPPLKKFAFIGSGPLPLTSLCISQTAASFISPHESYGIRRVSSEEEIETIEVLNIDINPKAISESQKLCEALGPGATGMKFLCSRADSPTLDLQGFDVVYLAALVGATHVEKEVLLESVVGRMREGAFLVVRSAERLRRLMYPAFDPTTEKVQSCLEICLAVHPYNNVVNSVIIGKVRPRTEKGLPLTGVA